MDTSITIALIAFGGAILGSGGVTAIINHFLSKKSKTAKQLDRIESRMEEIEAKVDQVDAKVDRNEAQRARAQILRFADEIYQGQLHTKEHFDEILSAATLYNQYCDDHPTFENMRTVSAQKRITDVYNKCLNEHTFITEEP